MLRVKFGLTIYEKLLPALLNVCILGMHKNDYTAFLVIPQNLAISITDLILPQKKALGM